MTFAILSFFYIAMLLLDEKIYKIILEFNQWHLSM